ncbi:salivary acidic proline-rich phosphoprotein 1/2-like [Pithys albifrons albifrons]|uniref:salivary acidic proline-rich phosphoprotein 1/2-like n=1 Tax=Pithys albifrons albifrons TaxID=3385563 RepID=UPI003A5CB73F
MTPPMAVIPGGHSCGAGEAPVGHPGRCPPIPGLSGAKARAGRGPEPSAPQGRPRSRRPRLPRTRAEALPASGSAWGIPGRGPGTAGAGGRPRAHRTALGAPCRRGRPGTRGAAPPPAPGRGSRTALTDPLAVCVPRNGGVRQQEPPAGQSPHAPGG